MNPLQEKLNETVDGIAYYFYGNGTKEQLADALISLVNETLEEAKKAVPEAEDWISEVYQKDAKNWNTCRQQTLEALDKMKIK